MFYHIVAILALAASALANPVAKPDPSFVAAPYAVAPAIAPAVVTAQSSQVFARQYNALATPLVAPAPLVAAPAPLVAAPTAPLLASYRYASPYFTAPYLF